LNWAITSRTGTITTERKTPTPSAPGYDSATTAWVAAVGSGNVTIPRKDLINALIVTLKSGGVWTKLDRLWDFAAENTTCALVDLKALATATAVNSPTFTTDRGYTGNGSTSYIDTNFNPGTGTPNYTGNAACFGIWDITTSPNSGTVPIGINYFGHYSEGTIHYPDGNSYWRVNTSGAGLAVAYPGPGLHMANRSAAGNDQLYRNGSSIVTSTTSATALTATNFYVCARNNDSGTPTAGSFSTDQIAAVVFGGTLSSTEHGTLYTALRTYMTAVGVP
jgi:hypothetical protein